ncbi:uncharacterized protein C8Q71DRAFT_727577 [Rhodofomes roseus]|uniref:Uncharacterized protein n=1 Tax=Rhodofomes roseus TaxID=34475 RepID=A0ABQ8K142_9APHY|nr:uncharacterized protein C8Q71DRAFT_727577 [Rhodofomes roseus]KAH9830342.1 hypothetical protein C8Q71DRAFT_727577 [Rhodofomes roseus]
MNHPRDTTSWDGRTSLWELVSFPHAYRGAPAVVLRPATLRTRANTTRTHRPSGNASPRRRRPARASSKHGSSRGSRATSSPQSTNPISTSTTRTTASSCVPDSLNESMLDMRKALFFRDVVESVVTVPSFEEAESVFHLHGTPLEPQARTVNLVDIFEVDAFYGTSESFSSCILAPAISTTGTRKLRLQPFESKPVYDVTPESIAHAGNWRCKTYRTYCIEIPRILHCERYTRRVTTACRVDDMRHPLLGCY